MYEHVFFVKEVKNTTRFSDIQRKMHHAVQNDLVVFALKMVQF